jgi:hypothetical protein
MRLAQIGTRHGHAAGKWQALRSRPDLEAVGIWEPDATARAAAQAGGTFAGAHWFADAARRCGRFGGCKFSNRCPYGMPECRQAPPPLYRTADDRAVACYFHTDGAPVSGREMAESLAGT